VRFECLYGEDWIATSPTEDALATAAQECGESAWQAFFEFVPADVREFLERFSFTRMEALQVIARCPSLLSDLTETPALGAFVAAHANLRGTSGACWEEINVVHERNGVFGLLEWLGLPASRPALGILQNIVTPDVPKRFLEPLRSMLWEPTALFALRRMPAITDRELARTCHALAA
ncbi:MAG TPA: hypothetical protein VEA63_08545, partial [Opitutus sp.]|nr:hypothetical protein [Opitutus sp.]